MSDRAYIRHILIIYSAYIAVKWKIGGREGKRGTIIPRSKQRQASRYHAKKRTKRGRTPSYYSEKQTKKKANFALSREEADKEGEDSELADDGG